MLKSNFDLVDGKFSGVVLLYKISENLLESHQISFVHV